MALIYYSSLSVSLQFIRNCIYESGEKRETLFRMKLI